MGLGLGDRAVSAYMYDMLVLFAGHVEDIQAIYNLACGPDAQDLLESQIIRAYICPPGVVSDPSTVSVIDRIPYPTCTKKFISFIQTCS